MEIGDLLYSVQDLIALFLPGFVFVSIYDWIRAKKREITSITVVSLFVTYVIRIFYSCLHIFILSSFSFSSSFSSMIYTFTGALTAVLIVKVQDSGWFRKYLRCLTHKSINDDLFKDVLDYDFTLTLRIWLRDGNTEIIGDFQEREEKGGESFWALRRYHIIDLRGSSLDKLDYVEKKILVVPQREILKMEFLYDDKSEVWKRLDDDEPETQVLQNETKKPHAGDCNSM